MRSPLQQTPISGRLPTEFWRFFGGFLVNDVPCLGDFGCVCFEDCELNQSRFGNFDEPNIGAYPPKLSCNSKPSHNRGTGPLITMINIDQQYLLLLLLQGILQIPEKEHCFSARSKDPPAHGQKAPPLEKHLAGWRLTAKYALIDHLISCRVYSNSCFFICFSL